MVSLLLRVLGVGRVRIFAGAVAGALIWQASGTMPAPLDQAVASVRSVAWQGMSEMAGLLPRGSSASASPEVVVQGRWQRCSVPVLVNPGPLGDAAVVLTRQALDRVSSASGVRFEFAGRTDEVPSSRWVLEGPRGGSAVPPVVVAFVERGASDLLGSDWLAGAVANPGPRGKALRTGAVAVALDTWGGLAPGFAAGRSQGNVLLHELGHVAGLGHGGESHLMHAEVSDASPEGFSSAELAVLGRIAPSC